MSAMKACCRCLVLSTETTATASSSSSAFTTVPTLDCTQLMSCAATRLAPWVCSPLKCKARLHLLYDGVHKIPAVEAGSIKVVPQQGIQAAVVPFFRVVEIQIAVCEVRHGAGRLGL